jgi:hypothetical protein
MSVDREREERRRRRRRKMEERTGEMMWGGRGRGGVVYVRD